MSVARMRAIDRLAMGRYGLPGEILMEHAGRAAAGALGLFRVRTAAVFCGGGNNGGDGLAAARHLANAGWDVRLVLAQPPARYAGHALAHWRAVKALGVPHILFHSAKKLLQSLKKPWCVVDALLGTGVRPPLREPYGALIALINGARRPVLALDVPSGLDADSGRAEGGAVKARVTLAMGLPKRGLLLPRAKPWVGRLLVADIGFPKVLISPFFK